MEYKNPFIKVEWDDTPENLTQERIKRVKQYFQEKYNSTNVKVIPKSVYNISSTKLGSLETNDNILDFQYQKKLVKEYIKNNNIEIDYNLLNRLDDRVNSQIDNIGNNKKRYNKWYIKKIEFSNFLCFGENNVIEFDNLNGITIIEGNPRNFSGKSTISTDLIKFLFFNTTTKGKTNIEVFNLYTDIDEVKVKGYVNIDGEDYVISRIISRKLTKSGDYNVKSDLEFYKINNIGEIFNLNEEQRRETEKIITSAIGTEDDFLSTILTTGYNLEEMIQSKPTYRGMILSKFLGLEHLSEKEVICKNIYNEWSKKLVSNSYNKVELEINNKNFIENINNNKIEIKNLDKNLKKLKKDIVELEDKKDNLLKSRNNDIEHELLNINPDVINSKLNSLRLEIKNLENNFSNYIVLEPSEYYLEDNHVKIKDEINDLILDKRFKLNEIEKNENIINKLVTESICSMCNRPFDEIDNTNEINRINNDVLSLKILIEKINDDLKLKNDIEQHFTLIKKEYDEYEKRKLYKERLSLEINQKKLEIDEKQRLLDNYNKNKIKLDDNKKIDSEYIIIKSKIESLTGESTQISNSINKITNTNIELEKNIELNKELIKKIEFEEQYLMVFKTYLMIYGKNGISKVIMKNIIPLLNNELYNLLSDSAYFTVEININDKNELEFLMIDNDTRKIKPLYSGSGYEKTVSSLAIRSVLTKISALPKPNIVVMDEVFGKIADENLEMVGEFFKKIKNYFENIFIISHNPLMRNWADNIIMVKKDENISNIEYITTKN